MNEPPWKCERCSAGDNATRYHNAWDVNVCGERSADVPDMPELGEDYYDTQHTVGLCDRCAKRDDTPAWLLAYALRGELASQSNKASLGARALSSLLEGSTFGRRGS